MRGRGWGDGCFGICAKIGFGLAQALREAAKRLLAFHLYMPLAASQKAVNPPPPNATGRTNSF